jgi:hypothetical protein
MCPAFAVSSELAASHELCLSARACPFEVADVFLFSFYLSSKQAASLRVIGPLSQA